MKEGNVRFSFVFFLMSFLSCQVGKIAVIDIVSIFVFLKALLC